MNPSPIIKDTCLLCGDGMTADCNLCWKNGTRVSLRPARRKPFDLSLCVAVILSIIFAVTWFFVLNAAGPQKPAPVPAPAIANEALYESQIRELTHEIQARETQLDRLVSALEATAQERDAALNLIGQIQRGQGL